MGFISNGTTMFDNGALVASAGNLVLLSTATASSSASISFNSTYLTSTYQLYKFEFINCHPQTDSVNFDFNMSTDNGSNYNVTKTSTFFRSYHLENDTDANVGYVGSGDLAQGTGFQNLSRAVGSGADESTSGSLILFNPASSVFVKHFISTTNVYQSSAVLSTVYVAGYGNTTSAVNAIRFQMSSGNFDGTIKLYGLKD